MANAKKCNSGQYFMGLVGYYIIFIKGFQILQAQELLSKRRE
jgi:hypothetical protein